jgi:hypothetical protein
MLFLDMFGLGDLTPIALLFLAWFLLVELEILSTSKNVSSALNSFLLCNLLIISAYETLIFIIYLQLDLFLTFFFVCFWIMFTVFLNIGERKMRKIYGL